MDLALMIEGQAGLNWPRWQRIAQAAEDLGFAGLYRSDHFTDSNTAGLGTRSNSGSRWPGWRATPAHPFRPAGVPGVFPPPGHDGAHGRRGGRPVGRAAETGGGRRLADPRTRHYGFDLLDVPLRMARFEEGLEVITRLLHSDTPVSYSGMFYQLNEAILLPRPQRPGGPPIIIGGGLVGVAAGGALRARMERHLQDPGTLRRPEREAG